MTGVQTCALPIYIEKSGTAIKRIPNIHSSADMTIYPILAVLIGATERIRSFSFQVSHFSFCKVSIAQRDTAWNGQPAPTVVKLGNGGISV